MKNNSFAKCGLLLALFVVSACGKPEEKIVCEVAKSFSEAYYNMNIRKAKEFCCQDLHTIMDFRRHNLTKRDLAYRDSAGKASIRIVDCVFNSDDDVSYVNVEVSNFIRINYMNDSLSVVPCDTMELTLTKELDDVWRIKSLL